MESDINEHYATLRDKLTKTITDKFDSFYDGKEDDLKPLIEFISYTDRLFERQSDLINGFQVADDNRTLWDESVKNVMREYDVKRIFDLDKAQKFLVNGLIYVITKDFSFNGLTFDNGVIKISKNNIVKKEIVSADKIAEYQKKINDLKDELKRS